MNIRLQSVGSLLEDQGTVSEDGNSIEKDAIMVYTGQFESMDGPVEITDDHIDLLASNHNSVLSKVARMATGQVPMKACPPIQLDHSTSAMMTVGRLVGDLTIGETEIDGEKRKALMGKVKILGKENVEKVMDGRWTNLSIGADLEKGKVNELSITPFPAAEGASLLSKLALQVKEGDRVKVTSGSQEGKSGTVIETDGDYAIVKIGGFEQRIHVGDLTRMSKRLGGKVHNDGNYWVVTWNGTKCFESKDRAEAESELKKVEAKYKAAEEAQEDLLGPDKVKEQLDKIKKILKNGKNTGGTMYLYRKLRDVLMSKHKLSQEDAEKKLEGMDDKDLSKLAEEVDESGQAGGVHIDIENEKLKKHLMDKEKLSAEDADKKLKEMGDDEKKELAGKIDEDEKLAAAESDDEKAEKKAQMAKKAEFIKLAKEVRVKSQEAQVQLRASRLSARIARLRSELKITPAEAKKIDVVALAKKDAKESEAMLSGYESREPVLDITVRGTSKAVDIQKIAAKYRLAKLEMETRMNMPSKKKEVEKFAKEMEEHQKELVKLKAELGSDPEASTEEKTEMESSYDAVCKMLDDGMDKERVKEALRKMLSVSMQDGKPMAESDEKRMSALEQTLEKVQTQYQELIALTGKVLGVETKELE